jgi:shikimate dehydrogenase
MADLGLIGYPLSHSFSVKYFAEKFQRENIVGWSYRNFPIDSIDKLKELIQRETSLVGLNVTIPYKEQVIPYIKHLDPVAAEVGAVNTIRINRNAGKTELYGYNSDVFGFRESLKPLLGKRRDALILGTGGASKAIRFVLEQLGISYHAVSRKPAENQLSYRDLCLPVMRKHTLIINTTPLGTYPDIETFPDIPYDLLSPEHLLYDLVYNPSETAFLRLGRLKGTKTKNGLEMLELQAEDSWRFWNADY